MLAVICLISTETEATLVFDDGATHEIDYTINKLVQVRAKETFWGQQATTVNLLSGGIIVSSLWAYDNSQISIFDGSIEDEFRAYEGCYVNISGGSISNNFKTRDNSQAYISGGAISSLQTSDNSYMNISDGSIDGGLFAEENSRVDVSGGRVGHNVDSEGNSRVNISGGLETGNNIYIRDYSVVTIYGSDFVIDGVSLESGTFGAYPNGSERHGLLTGTLSNGDPINNYVHIKDDAKLVLIPEPTTLLLLGLGTLVLRKRK